MKKLTDYYVLITENIVDEVIEYFGLHFKRNDLIGKSLVFAYDDKNSQYFRHSKAYTKTRLKWSKMKRFIENSPTREKYLSAQQQSKGYKKCWIEEKQRRELLGQNFDTLLSDVKRIESNYELSNEILLSKSREIIDLEFTNYKLNERIERLTTERDVLVKLAKENGLTNKQTLTDWVNSILESNKSKSDRLSKLFKECGEYIELSEDFKQSRNKYYKEVEELKKVVEASNITQEFLNQENKRLKRRNRILTIGFILSASFYLIASIF